MSQVPWRDRPELLGSGHLACQGCGGALAMRHVLNTLGPRTVAVIPACCWTIITGPFPYSALGIPVLHTAFETAAVTASGVRAALDLQGDQKTTVMAWAGDGGTFDIGLQSLSGAAERNENILYVCYDNEGYMNTGVQRSSATPAGAWTTTTPHKKHHPKKDLLQILAAHRIPYAATASIAYLDDLVAKVKRTQAVEGMRFLHLLAPCPSGWKTPPDLTVKLARLSVQSGVFPLLEIEDGKRWILNEPTDRIPVDEYFRLQGRFRNLSDQDLGEAQQRVDLRFEELMQRVQART